MYEPDDNVVVDEQGQVIRFPVYVLHFPFFTMSDLVTTQGCVAAASTAQCPRQDACHIHGYIDVAFSGVFVLDCGGLCLLQISRGTSTHDRRVLCAALCAA